MYLIFHTIRTVIVFYVIIYYIMPFILIILSLYRDYYEEGAILLQEDAMMLHGLMVGLNCIDCHLSIRDNTKLDDQVSFYTVTCND